MPARRPCRSLYNDFRYLFAYDNGAEILMLRFIASSLLLMAAAGAPLGPPFDIPSFTISGVLPPYLGPTATDPAAMSPYPTTLTRIANRLCASGERKVILRGLLRYRQALNGIGLSDGFQWLSGSFMEDIETIESRPPRDIDVVTFIHRPAAVANDPAWLLFFNAHLNLFQPPAVKAAYHCDAYFIDMNTGPENIVNQTRYWFGLFGHRRTGLWKGLLQLPLAVSQDDTDASGIVGP